MRVCVLNSTGELLEMQSDATEGTLLGNAVAAGYDINLISEKEVTFEEFQLLLYRPPALEAVKKKRIAEINAECEKEIISGIMSAADGTMRKYDSDIVDQLNFTQAMLMAQISGQPVPYRVWKSDLSGKEWITLTYAQFCQILADGATIKAALLQKCSTKKELIANCTSIEGVEAITWTSIE